ncbi:hypothetical protein PINS_up010319 [Pythium insidiosum]|nr:hypothetical protein PINS_up010319 [Pythium insidiosum]
MAGKVRAIVPITALAPVPVLLPAPLPVPRSPSASARHVSFAWSSLPSLRVRRSESTSHHAFYPNAVDSSFVSTTTSASLSPWRQGVRAIGLVLRNASACAVWAWATALGCSYGDVLSGRSVADQSMTSYVLGLQLWSELFFTVSIIAVETVGLSKLHFLARPRRKPGLFFVLHRLLRRLWWQLVLLFAVVVATGYALTTQLPRAWRFLHLEAYAFIVISHVFFTHTVVATREIFKHETVDGQLRIIRLGNQGNAGRSQTHSSASRASYWRAFRRVYVGLSYTIAAVGLASLFVHTTMFLTFSATRDFLVFSVVSQLIKVAVQELAKCMILRRHRHDIRATSLIVGAPTVLIDTQVRVALQRISTVQSSIVSIAAFTAMEFAMRIGKVGLLHLQIRRRQQRDRRRAQRQVEQQHASPTARHVAVVANGATTTSHDKRRTPVPNHAQVLPFPEWRFKLLSCFATELYADMLAEYMAMACTGAIVFFYWDNPKYLLNDKSNESADSDASVGFSGSQQRLLALQIAVEIVVDFTCFLIEHRSGINFLELQRHATFVTAVFVAFGSINILICAAFYLKNDDMQ